jgi:hypothetical protein
MVCAGRTDCDGHPDLNWNTLASAAGLVTKERSALHDWTQLWTQPALTADLCLT